jgi:DNA-binding PadR family transcriptional regulator
MSSGIRLSPTSYIVLGLLDAAGEATPYDLKRTVAISLGNFWSLPHAQLYAEPARLAEGGYLNERREDGGRRRRYYKLTERGREALREWVAQPTAEMTELRNPAMLKIFFGGDPRQMAEAQLPVRRAKVAAYEQMERDIEGHVPEGMLITLRIGLAHEREWVDFWSRLLEDEQAKNQADS